MSLHQKGRHSPRKQFRYFKYVALICLSIGGTYSLYRVFRSVKARIALHDEIGTQKRKQYVFERVTIYPDSGETFIIHNSTGTRWPSGPVFLNGVYSNNFPPIDPKNGAQLRLDSFRKGNERYPGLFSTVTEIQVNVPGFKPITRSFLKE